MRLLFKSMLTIDALSLLLAVYLIKSQCWLQCFGVKSIIVYLMIPFMLGILCIVLSNQLTEDSIEGGIVSVELANDSFLPSYLGYFFVALSIPNEQYITVSVVFFIVFVFLMFSQTLYYNPFFLLLGYNFYYVTNMKNMKIFIISKRNIKNPVDLKFNNLRRINYYTFFDKETMDESSDS